MEPLCCLDARPPARSALVPAILAACALGASVPSLAVPPTPTEVRIVGIEPGRYLIHWISVGDEWEYEIEESEDGGDFESIATVDPVAAGEEGEYEVLDPLLPVRRWRVRARDPEDDTLSSPSPELLEPLWETGDNFRVFYNFPANGAETGCPPYEDKSTCTTQLSFPDFVLDLFEGARDEYLDLGFNEPGNPMSADLFPVNLKPCDGIGCAASWGIGLGPDWVGLYDDDINSGEPATLILTIHEYFHKVQGAHGGSNGFDLDPAPKWVTEGQARAIQDLLCIQTLNDDCVHIDDEPSGGANYFGEVQAYLADPNRPLNEIEYTSALFWTFLCQRYGKDQSEPERGIDFLLEFWLEAQGGPSDRDAFEVIEATIAKLTDAGTPETFVEAWQQFAINTYAKDLPAAAAAYRYADESQDPFTYGKVVLTTDADLGMFNQIGPVDDAAVSRWGAAYHEVRPTSLVGEVQVEFHVQNGVPCFFALLEVRDGEIVDEDRHLGLDFSRAVANPDDALLDAVVVVVAGLEQNVNYVYSFNATDPVMQIVKPTKSTRVYVGPPAAPGKFVAIVKFLAPDATPLAGVDPDDVEFRVGSALVTNVIQSFSVGGGQYWFVLGAPVQAANGTYDLEASWASLSAAEEDAVRYGDDPVPDTNNAICVDRSPSMADPWDKIQAGRAAARIFVDSLKSGDQFAVTSFSGDDAGGCEPHVDLAFTSWSEASRDDAHDAISAMGVPSGRTTIGDGLFAALGELDKDESDPRPPQAIFLLSDGLNNCGQDTGDFLAEYDSRKKAGTAVPVVHSVAIGADADRLDLAALADATGGELLVVPGFPDGEGGGAGSDELDFRWALIEKHRLVAEWLSGEQRVASQVGGGQLGEEVVECVVDAGATELVATVTWTPERPHIELRDPAGVTDYPATLSTSQHWMWKIPDPIPGTWTLTLIGDTTCPIPSPTACPTTEFLAEAAVRSALTMEVALGLPRAEREVGRPMPIIAALSDAGPVTGASVTALVRSPLDVATIVTLFDDGAHGDSEKQDGVYAGTYFGTNVPGLYRIDVTATGSTPLLGEFVRARPLQFWTRGGPNSDGDCVTRVNPSGLPDSHEARTGTDPRRDDGSSDPDGDGLTNCDEFDHGTHPLDPDSDDDGENDGSEVAGGRDPRDPTDGTITAPWGCAEGGAGRVVLRFRPVARAAAYEISRAEGEHGAFGVIVPAFVPARGGAGVFIDTRVQNDIAYRYRLVALGPRGERSAPSGVCTATPKADPSPPHGSVRIDDGASTVASPEVTLTLVASDRFDPAHEHDEAEPGAVISGVADMQVLNQSDFAGAEWLRYATTVERWILEPNAAGVATVYARFRDGAGNVSETVHSSVRVVDTNPPCAARDARCSFDAVRGAVTVEWSLPDDPPCRCEGFTVVCTTEDGSATRFSLPSDALRFVHEPSVSELCPSDTDGMVVLRYCIECSGGAEPGPAACCRVEIACPPPPRGGRQRPCDFNQDGNFDIGDPIALLNYLFLGRGAAPCGGSQSAFAALLDCNGDGGIDLADAVSQLNYLFLGGPSPRQGTDCMAIPDCPDRCAR